MVTWPESSFICASPGFSPISSVISKMEGSDSVLGVASRPLMAGCGKDHLLYYQEFDLRYHPPTQTLLMNLFLWRVVLVTIILSTPPSLTTTMKSSCPNPKPVQVPAGSIATAMRPLSALVWTEFSAPDIELFTFLSCSLPSREYDPQSGGPQLC